MANRQNKFLIKRSNVAGKIPSPGDLLLGEMALNTADVKLFTSGTTENSILPIGWDRVSRTGDTINGDLIINGDLTVTGDTIVTNLSASTISNVDYIDFDTTFTGTTIEGRLHWDIGNGGPTIGMEGGNVSQQIGQETYYYIKNQSGATIENGRVVRAAGTVGGSGKILGEYMIADGTVSANLALGIATEDILNGTDGFVTEFGLVRGFDTTGTPYGETWNDGDIVYVSSTIDGGLTKVQPIAPNLHIEMAIVILAGANGSVFVRPHRYPHIHDLQDVAYSAGTESNLDVIQWDGTLSAFTITNTPQFTSVSASTISGGTLYGDGSNLTGIGLEVITVGENVSKGDVLFLSGNSKYYKSSNTNELYSSTELRLAISAITADATGSAVIQGKFTTTGLTAGENYWIGTNGNYTSTQPTGDGDIVRYVGSALSTTELEFNPDGLYVEISSSSGVGTQPLLRNVTTSQTILTTDYTINVSTTGATTQTLPTAVGVQGKIYNVKNSDSTSVGIITMDTTSSQLIDTLYTSVAGGNPITIEYPTSLKFQSDGSNWILI